MLDKILYYLGLGSLSPENTAEEMVASVTATAYCVGPIKFDL